MTAAGARMRGLSGQLVVVTGASSGIGAATVARFLEEGAGVIGLARGREGLDRLAATLPVTATYTIDVAVEAQVRDVFARLRREHGSPDVLVNNAGITLRRPFDAISLREWREVMRVDLDGAFVVAQVAARQMAGRAGVIVNMASTNAFLGYRNHAAYSSAKAALVELTRCMALDLAPAVRVNAVCPGYIDTPMLSYDRSIGERVPLRRLGRAEEVAALVAFLASADAAYITGQALVIDGGETAGSPSLIGQDAGCESVAQAVGTR